MGTNNSQQQMHASAVATHDQPRELVAGTPLEAYLPYQMFRIVNRLTLNLKSDLRPENMTLSRWRALSVLNASNGCSMGDLAVYMVIEQAALSRIVGQMERDGLVHRRIARADNRVVQVYLTATGRRKFRAIRPLELRHYQQLIKDFTQAEHRVLEASLQRLWENINTQSTKRT